MMHRRTLLDPKYFLIPQFWEAADDQSIWWDLKYLYAFLKNANLEKSRRHKWFRKFISKVNSVTAFPRRESPAGWAEETCDTLGLVSFLWASADDCKDSNMKDACTCFIRNMLIKATELIADPHQLVTIRHTLCKVYSGGQMSSFLEACRGHQTTYDTLANAWSALFDAGTLSGTFYCDRHSVMDIATFFMQFCRRRRQYGKKISPGLERLVAEVSLPMMKWIAGAVDFFVLRVYGNDNQSVRNRRRFFL